MLGGKLNFSQSVIDSLLNGKLKEDIADMIMKGKKQPEIAQGVQYPDRPAAIIPSPQSNQQTINREDIQPSAPPQPAKFNDDIEQYISQITAPKKENSGEEDLINSIGEMGKSNNLFASLGTGLAAAAKYLNTPNGKKLLSGVMSPQAGSILAKKAETQEQDELKRKKDIEDLGVKSQLEYLLSQSKLGKKEEAPLKIGQGEQAFRLNPDTGEYENIASVPAKPVADVSWEQSSYIKNGKKYKAYFNPKTKELQKTDELYDVPNNEKSFSPAQKIQIQNQKAQIKKNIQALIDPDIENYNRLDKIFNNVKRNDATILSTLPMDIAKGIGNEVGNLAQGEQERAMHIGSTLERLNRKVEGMKSGKLDDNTRKELLNTLSELKKLKAKVIRNKYTRQLEVEKGMIDEDLIPYYFDEKTENGLNSKYLNPFMDTAQNNNTNTPKISTQKEYDNLPKGSLYIAPNGKTMRKK